MINTSGYHARCKGWRIGVVAMTIVPECCIAAKGGVLVGIPLSIALGTLVERCVSPQPPLLLACVVLTVLLSILLHGASAQPIANWLGRQQDAWN